MWPGLVVIPSWACPPPAPRESVLQSLALMKPSVSKGTLGVVLREAVLCQEKTEESEVMASVLGTMWAMRVCVSPFLKL